MRRVLLLAALAAALTRPTHASMVDATPMVDELTRSITGLLSAGGYDALEAGGRGAWIRRERTPAGGWMLFVSVQAMADLPKEATPAEWNNRMAALQRWHTERPGSELATEVLAAGYVNWAWRARGTGYGSSLTEQRSNDFEDRLNLARELLETTAALPDPTPERALALLHLGLGLGWDMDRLRQAADAGLALEPAYAPILESMVNALLPRWHGGGSREWEQYARTVAAKGSRWDLYALMICKLTSLGDIDDDLRGVVSWRLARKGFDQLDVQFPNSLKLWSKRAQLAMILAEGTGAAEAFGRLGGEYDPVVFPDKSLMMKQISWAGQARAYEQHVLPMKWAAYGGTTFFVLLLLGALLWRWLKKPI